ncbi:MAG: hypothetical protein KDD64_00350 [Bdellovibrionales bacterium]|nr:hypothetical protein [Bdellovibrionales bacterium]
MEHHHPVHHSPDSSPRLPELPDQEPIERYEAQKHIADARRLANAHKALRAVEAGLQIGLHESSSWRDLDYRVLTQILERRGKDHPEVIRMASAVCQSQFSSILSENQVSSLCHCISGIAVAGRPQLALGLLSQLSSASTKDLSESIDYCHATDLAKGILEQQKRDGYSSLESRRSPEAKARSARVFELNHLLSQAIQSRDGPVLNGVLCEALREGIVPHLGGMIAETASQPVRTMCVKAATEAIGTYLPRLELLADVAFGLEAHGDSEGAKDILFLALTETDGIHTTEDIYRGKCLIAEAAGRLGFRSIAHAILDSVSGELGPFLEYYERDSAPVVAVARAYSRIGEPGLGIALFEKFSGTGNEHTTPLVPESELSKTARACARAELPTASFIASRKFLKVQRGGLDDVTFAYFDLVDSALKTFQEIGGDSVPFEPLNQALRNGELSSADYLRIFYGIGNEECISEIERMFEDGEVSRAEVFEGLATWKPPILMHYSPGIINSSLSAIQDYLVQNTTSPKDLASSLVSLASLGTDVDFRRLEDIVRESIESENKEQRSRVLQFLVPFTKAFSEQPSKRCSQPVYDVGSYVLNQDPLNNSALIVGAFHSLRKHESPVIKVVLDRASLSLCSHSEFPRMPSALVRTVFDWLTDRRSRLERALPDFLQFGETDNSEQRKFRSYMGEVVQRFLDRPSNDIAPASLARAMTLGVTLQDGQLQKAILDRCRGMVFEETTPPALRQACVSVLSQFGSKSDQDSLLSYVRDRYHRSGPNDPILNLCLLNLRRARGTGGDQVFDLAGGDFVPFEDDFPDFNPHHQRRSGIRECELILDVATDPRVEGRFTRVLLRRLTELKYLDPEILTWLEQSETSSDFPARAGCIRMLRQYGVVPSKTLLEYFTRDGSSPESIRQRFAKLESYRQTFDEVEDLSTLLSLLSSDVDGQIAFFVLRSPSSRFQLINNYPFERFQEIVELAQSFRLHPAPLEQFRGLLEKSGIQREHTERIVSNLIRGRHPFHTAYSPTLEQEVRIDISESNRIRIACAELSQVLGSDQLGGVLLTMASRPILQQQIDDGDHSQETSSLLRSINQADTLIERERVANQIEADHPVLYRQAKELLLPGWESIEGLLQISLPLEEVLHSSPKVEGDQLLAGIELLRRSRKESKLAVLQALKGTNPQIAARQKEIRRKEKALRGVQAGVEMRPEDQILQEKVTKIEEDLVRLREEVRALTLSPVVDRYRHLTPRERKEQIESEEKYLKAVVEKSASRLFLSSLVEVLDEKTITEGDAELLKELASHLDHPFETILSIVDLSQVKKQSEKEKTVRLRLLDKCGDLTTFARFADSRLCCYSSTNYEMKVFGRPNKEWLAARMRDPMSFVWVIEEDQPSAKDESTVIRNNLGFVMGDYGATNDGGLTLNLNGIYLTTGNEEKGAANILQAIEKLQAEPLRAEAIILGGSHGGALPSSFANFKRESREVTRLRALADIDGSPMQGNYDDLGTVMNWPTTVAGFVRDLDRESQS